MIKEKPYHSVEPFETGSLCLRAHNAIDSERPMAETQKWVYHLHLEMTVLIAVAGENGRIVIQGGPAFNVAV